MDYTAITLEDALTPDKYNTNNYPGLSPEEYVREVKKTHKDVWVKYFPDNSRICQLSVAQLRVLKDAAAIGIFTMKRTDLYAEELQSVEDYISAHLRLECEYFVRFSDCSPKDGVYGKRMRNAKEIIDNIVTSKRCWQVLERTTAAANLYICTFRKDWHERNEFRAFVYRGRLTAISQYSWCRDYGWTRELIAVAACKMAEYIRNNVIPVAVANICESFVVDVIIVDSNVELIEFNSFGAELSSGSALFEWQRDRGQLYSDGSIVYVRYVCG